MDTSEAPPDTAAITELVPDKAAWRSPADQRRNHHRPGGNKNEAGIDAVFIEGSDFLRHPQSGSRRANRGKAECDFFLIGRVALRRMK